MKFSSYITNALLVSFACFAGSLGAMDDKVTLHSQDGVEVQVTLKVAKQAETLNSLIEDAGTEQAIPLPNVVGVTLLRFVDLLQMLDENPDSKVFEKLSAKSLANFSVKDLSDLLFAANYLDNAAILNVVAAQITAKVPHDLIKYLVGAFSGEEFKEDRAKDVNLDQLGLSRRNLSRDLVAILRDLQIDFEVIVYNVKGLVYKPTIKVDYLQDTDSPVSKKVKSDSIKPLGNVSQFALDTEIQFSGYGEVGSKLVAAHSISVNSLRQEWNRVKQYTDNPLVIVVSPGYRSTSVSYTYKIPEHLVVKERKRVELGNPFAAFDRIRHWQIQGLLNEDSFLKLQPNEWRTVLVPAGFIQNATTSEDVSRYILGLGQQYTSEDIERAQNDLQEQWSSDNLESLQDESFAIRVRALVQHARNILQQALLDKAQ